MKAIIYKDELGKEFDVVDIPAEHADAADAAREHLVEEVSHYDDELVELILEDAEIPVEQLKARDPQGHARAQADPGPLRLGVQEQGRAAAARRRPRLPAQPARRPADVRASMTVRGQDEPREVVRPRRRLRPVRRAGLQDHGRPLRRQAHLLPRVLRQALGRRARAQRLHRSHRARRAHPDDARQRPRGGRRGLRGRHRRGRRHQADRHRRHAGRPRRADPAREHHLPRAGHQGRRRAQDQGRPGEDVRRPRPPGRGGPDLPRRRPTRRPARPRSPAWASCTSRSSSTA